MLTRYCSSNAIDLQDNRPTQIGAGFAACSSEPRMPADLTAKSRMGRYLFVGFGILERYEVGKGERHGDREAH